MAELKEHLERQTDEFRDFFWHRLRWRAVSAHVPSDRPYRLLDVGAGAGFLGHFLATDRRLVEYHFEEPIESLRRRLVERYGPDRELPADGDRHGYRIVTALDVMEHVPDDRGFIFDLLGTVDIGTTFVLTVPALSALWSSWDVSLGHYRRYDRASVRRLLSQLPVDVIEVSYMFPELVLPGLWRARSIPSGALGGWIPETPEVAQRIALSDRRAERRPAPLGAGR